MYGTEVKKVFGEPKPGDVISLKDFRDRALGSAIYNPDSQIVARRISRRRQDLDADFFTRRLARADDYRQRLPVAAEPGVYRVIWSESDGLPGVIVDRYGEQIAFQTQTLAMDQRRDLLVEAIRERFEPEVLVERNDSVMRAAEKLETRKTVLAGKPERRTVRVSGIVQQVDLWEGQKTGLYLDQLDNYVDVARHASGRRVLDAFCNQGGFALAAAGAGAAEVTGVDASGGAIELAKENARAMDVEARFEEGNAFDFLREREAEGATYDLVVLDPPSFTRNRKSLRDALRGYKEIHLRALKLLEPGGLLSTFSCSHHVDHAAYLGVIREAAVDAKRNLRLVAQHGQRMDHPVLPLLPETEYLRGFTLEVMAAW